ncbi:hypothetical protein [Actinoplanes sp. NPDC051494]|uniref:hypothetical protein n=1 Tax=Actinoplanes sp. NPDC051494 TaxID=3363907 RepID=UPI0037BAC3F3
MTDEQLARQLAERINAGLHGTVDPETGWVSARLSELIAAARATIDDQTRTEEAPMSLIDSDDDGEARYELEARDEQTAQDVAEQRMSDREHDAQEDMRVNGGMDPDEPSTW